MECRLTGLTVSVMIRCEWKSEESDFLVAKGKSQTDKTISYSKNIRVTETFSHLDFSFV